MKRNLLFLVVLAIMLPLTTRAQLLWQVKHPSSTGVSYVVGTHHMAPLAMIDSIAGLRCAINSVDTVYGELDMAQMREGSNMMKLAQAMMAPADSTIDALLTPAAMDSLSMVMKRFVGSDAALMGLKGLKPAAVSSTLTVLIGNSLFGDQVAAIPIDEKIQQLAREVSKPVKGLENVDFQAKLLFGAPLERQRVELMEFVTNIDDEIEMLRSINQAYMNRDLTAIEEVIIPHQPLDSPQAQALIYNRNKEWANKLAPIMLEHPVLVAVGAAHLVGPFGLLERLRRLGYDVVPVDSPKSN